MYMYLIIYVVVVCVCRWGVLCFMVIKLLCRLEFMWILFKIKLVKNDDDVYILILNLLFEIVNVIEVVILFNVEDLMWVVREFFSWVWLIYLFINEYKNIMIRMCVNFVKKNKSLKNIFLNNCIFK